ncbi:MAG: hypothetical protein WB508_04835 [Aeromicrobium sp.]|uniref:hypothetical protein n=1 Tax=Aeromicrobium sp. TaxID=1871063 RepID=UPI003C4CBBD4
MPEPSEIFLPVAAALPVVEARLEAGWTLLAVGGFRVKRGDSTPDAALVADFAPTGTTDLALVGAALAAWPAGSDVFAELRFVPR